MEYYESSVPFVPAGKTNVLMLTINSFGNDTGTVDKSSFKTFFGDANNANAFSFELNDGASKVENFPTSYSVAPTGTKLYWELGESKISKSGTYTLTMTNTSGGTLSVNCEIIEVTFNAGDGTFAGDSGKTYVGYGMKNTGLHYFNVPGVETTPEGKSFLGWSTEPSQTGYEALAKDVGEGGELHAVYGVAKTYGIELQQGDAKVENLDFGSKNYTSGDYGVEKTVNLKNTGNTKLEGLRLTKTPQYFTVSPASFESLDGGDTKTISIKPKAGLAVGKYNETIAFLASGYTASLTATFEVTKPTVTVNITGDLTKTYGETKTSDDVDYTTSVDKAMLGGWKPTFNSEGFASGAAVGDYTITLDTSYKPANYDVVLGTTHQVIVNKAEPKPVNVTATGVLEGKDLSDSKLSGTFENPHDSSMKVKGTLAWEGGQADSTDLKAGSHSFKWKFTPSGEDSKNYEDASGSVNVNVTEKTPTEINLTSGKTFTYNGQQHGLTFTTNRPASERGDIVVEYKPQGSGSYSNEKPKDAGKYDVKASIAASDTYAEKEEIFEMTIEQRQLTIAVTGGDKVYDGTTDVTGELSFSYHNLVGSDSVEVKGYEAKFNDSKVGSHTLFVTGITLSGASAKNYKVEETVHAVANITPATITSVVPKENITKEYGESRILGVNDFNFTGLVNDEQPSVLSADFICQGQDRWANAGDYDITVSLHGGNYVLENTNAGKMTVTKATPRLLTDTLYVGKGVKDKPLRIVSISASFVNPNDSSMSVAGKVAWKEPGKIVEGDVEGTFEADWTFTPYDTKNYKEPTNLEKAKITIVDAIPVPFTVAEKEYIYNGKQQGPTDADISIDKVDDETSQLQKDEVNIRIEYRKYVELAKVAAVSEPGTDWSENMPTNAGKYQAKITVAPANEGLYMENENTISFSIEKATPDVSGVQKELKVKEGQTLHDANVKLNQPKGVEGKELPGSFAWQNGDTPVSDDGEVYQWQFTPEDTENYNSVSGTVTVSLAADERKISAKVYNLPSAHGYTDYAVVDVKGSGLLPGDTVAFFKDAACTEAIAEPAVVSEGDTEIVVEFSAGALEITKGSVYALITSSKKHTATAISYLNEIDLELPETLTVYTGGTKQFEAKAIGEDFSDAGFEIEGDQSGDLIGVKEASRTADILKVNVTGKQIGAASVIVEMTFPHPDETRHADETIVLRKTIVITVLEGCDLTIKGKVDSTVSDPAAHEIQYTLTLFEGGTSIPAKIDGTFTATKTIPRTNEISGGIMPIAQEPSEDITEEIILTFTNGVTTFTCKANESITIHGLPTGNRFQVRVKPLDDEVVSTDSDSVLEGNLTTEGGEVTSTIKEKLVESITLNPEKVELNVGDFYTLEAKITPEDVSEENRALTWTSSDLSVVTVSDENGLTNRITGVSEGTATVTATTKNGLSASCVVTVKGNSHPQIESFTVLPSEITLRVGGRYKLSAEIRPAADVTVSWESDNHEVATVDADGNVTAIGVGKATVTAWTVNNLSGTCKVTVISSGPSISEWWKPGTTFVPPPTYGPASVTSPTPAPTLPPEGGGESLPSSTPATGGGVANPSGGGAAKPESPQTGDERNIFGLALASGISLALAAACGIELRKGRRKRS